MTVGHTEFAMCEVATLPRKICLCLKTTTTITTQLRISVQNRDSKIIKAKLPHVYKYLDEL